MLGRRVNVPTADDQLGRNTEVTLKTCSRKHARNHDRSLGGCADDAEVSPEHQRRIGDAVHYTLYSIRIPRAEEMNESGRRGAFALADLPNERRSWSLG